MSRITRTGRDWLAPATRSTWQRERRDCFVPLHSPSYTERALSALRRATWRDWLALTMFAAFVGVMVLL